ncbi:ECF transporter S component [Streptococcus sp. X16XC17]|uniref:ECF transporter S component n=1 Tax=unclassified Streptococcus TaxID=2608887 RepID=UPI00066FD42A|nr:MULTISPECIES: ECF transporter S component [unclassified Streptococcus]TCD45715.1 ECF transporter S component [Streptococcus sp. X16XC17]
MKTKTNDLTLLAILTALTIVLGMFVTLPTPTGVTTLLDVGIFFTAFYLGGKEGAIVGGFSAFLFDLLAGYPQWMFISLLAHGGQGYLAGFSGKKRALGLVGATVFMVAIYFLASTVMSGLGAALAEVMTNTVQNIVGMIGGYLLYMGLKRLKA